MGNLCSFEEDETALDYNLEDIEAKLIYGSFPLGSYVTVLLSEVPQYLQHGKFYREIALDDPNPSINIPVANWKANDSVSNLDEFAQLLRTINFWILDEVPGTVLQFCYDNPSEKWEKICLDNLNEEVGRTLVNIYSCKGSIDAPIKTGRDEIVAHWIKQNSVISKYGVTAVSLAAANGELALLMRLCERGYPCYVKACEQAAENGHLECLRYLHARACPWGAKVCSLAAKRGHLECLRYAHEHGCAWDSEVTLSRFVPCLQYALQHGCVVHAQALHWATHFGSVPCVQFFHDSGSLLYEGLTDIAASNCDVEMLRFLISRNCPRHPFIVEKAACALGKFPHRAFMCIKYFVEEESLTISDRVYSIALSCGSLQCVKYMVDAGFPCDFVMSIAESTVHMRSVAHADRDKQILSCILYAHDHGYGINNLLIDVVTHNKLPSCQSFLAHLTDLTSSNVVFMPRNTNYTVPGNRAASDHRETSLGGWAPRSKRNNW